MPHIITGEIRKEPRIHNGTTYIVELSESFKDRDGERQYTNYTFFFSAKTDNMKAWYNDAFQQGKVVTVQCDQLKIHSREHNGTTYTSLQPAGFANLVFSQRGGGSAPQQQQQGGWGQPQQPQQQNQPRQQPQNNPPMDFDDDIPF